MRRFLFISAAIGLSACGWLAPAYPRFGETPYRVEGNTAAPDGGPAIHTVIYRQGPDLRVETVLPHYGRAVVVFDRATNAAYVLNPTIQQSAASPNTPTVETPTAPAAAPPAAIPPAAANTTIVQPPAPAAPRVIGVAVRISDADAPQPLETPWAALGGANARSIGGCKVAGQRGHEWQPTEAPAPGVERTACITADGIVLRVRENNRILFEATSVQHGPQSPALFGIPSGYQIIDPRAVAQRVGAATNQLNSVAGASSQQTPPPG